MNKENKAIFDTNAQCCDIMNDLINKNTMEKINIAELLKECPSGMELDCAMLDNIVFEGIDVSPSTKYPIAIRNLKTNETIYLTKYGQFVVKEGYKCIIFPKGKTTWEGFVPPRQFKDGDVLFVDCADKESDGDVYKYIFILKEIDSLDNYFSYCHLSIDGFFPSSQYLFDNRYIPRLATEEEKQKLFQAIKDNGYKWNAETKTLEKLIEPKFKIGNWYQCTKDFFGKGVTFNKNTAYYCAQEGCLQDKYGSHIAIIKDLYDNFKLWTIQDAKEGDVLAFNDEIIVIFKDLYNKTSFHSYCHIEDGIFTISKEDMPDWWEGRGFYPATKEQCNLLFQKIKTAGYEWNPETKTLEVVQKFKVWDRIKHKDDKTVITITGIKDNYYFIQYYNSNKNDYQNGKISFKDQDEYELASHKFDINTLVPFESRVLVRNNKSNKWHPATWGFYDSDSKYYPYKLVGVVARYCIPYKGNEHLLGKTDDCDEFYKTWK